MYIHICAQYRRGYSTAAAVEGRPCGKNQRIESGSGRKIIVSVRRLLSGARRRQKVTDKVTSKAHLRTHAQRSLATPRFAFRDNVEGYAISRLRKNAFFPAAAVVLICYVKAAAKFATSSLIAIHNFQSTTIDVFSIDRFENSCK